MFFSSQSKITSKIIYPGRIVNINNEKITFLNKPWLTIKLWWSYVKMKNWVKRNPGKFPVIKENKDGSYNIIDI
jgi:hypothetical protein